MGKGFPGLVEDFMEFIHMESWRILIYCEEIVDQVRKAIEKCEQEAGHLLAHCWEMMFLEQEKETHVNTIAQIYYDII